MKLLPLIWSNALRNPLRTFLTIGSLVAALTIFIFLRTLISNWTESSDIPEGARRLIVRHRVSLANVLPERHAERIKKVDGVEIVHPYHWVGGYLKEDEDKFFQNFAVDSETFFALWSELKVKPEVQKAWLEDRQAALVGKKLLEQFGWKVGSRFTLLGRIYPCDLPMVVVGTYEGFSDDETIFFHRKYLQESLRNPGNVGTFYLRVKDASIMPRVIAEIDKEFENSDAPTRTETEKDFVQGFVSMMGNVKGFFMSLAMAVLGAMLLIMVNTMAMAVRERTREIAIMKAIGFTPGAVVFIVVTESILTSLVGGLIACLGLRFFFEALGRPTILLFFPNFCPSWVTVGMGLGIALGMGIISGIMPAWRAARIDVVSGLRRVG